MLQAENSTDQGDVYVITVEVSFGFIFHFQFLRLQPRFITQ